MVKGMQTIGATAPRIRSRKYKITVPKSVSKIKFINNVLDPQFPRMG